MDRRRFLQTAGATALARGAGAAAQARPNILLMLGDDLAWHDCEPYGNRRVRTPNLSRLAREGMCFDGMFTATAMCAPTRQQLYTGMFPVRIGAYPNHSRVYDGVRAIPHHFGALGYRTGLTGKQHYGPPESFPFEIIGKPNADPDPADLAALRRFATRDRKQPFFAIVASHQPHTPWDRGDPALYPPASLKPAPYLVDCPAMREMLSKYYAEVTYFDRQVGAVLAMLDETGLAENTIVMVASEQGAPFPFGKWTCYDAGLKAGFIARWPGRVQPGSRNRALTQYVDIVPTLLEAAGADWRGAATGRADAHGRQGFDGSSFLPVLLGKAAAHGEYVYGVHTTRGIIEGSNNYPVRSVRSARYKYIRNLNSSAAFANVVTAGNGPFKGLLKAWAETGEAGARRAALYVRRPAEELYDIEADPNELTNLAGDPRLKAVEEQLRQRLDAWMAQQGDRGVETELEAESRQMKGPE
ncbi:MAG: sulfatase [Bryobacteraceae bacterium]